jgi:hypothetical protein
MGYEVYSNIGLNHFSLGEAGPSWKSGSWPLELLSRS